MSDLPARLASALEGRYRLEREIGEGGMATVYLADDLRHERKVALKVLKPELAAVVGAERFLAEIKTTANLQHPHILPLFDSGEAGGLLFYVMPFVEGETLRDRLDREGQLPVDEALRMTAAVASALDYAHRRGVVHRDIKPENILLHEREALLADFGIALAATRAGGERLTRIGSGLGTPHYMSPEQATGEIDVDARSDVYALGCVLYEMLVGEPPYTGSTAQAVIAKQLVDSVPSARRLRATVPEAVDGAIGRALAKAPVDRFDSAGDFVRALAAEPDGGGRSPHVRFRRWGLRAAAAGGLLALAVLLLNRTDAVGPPAEPTRIAMLPWTVVGGDEDLSYLREGLVYLLSASLDGVGPIRMVDPNALLAFVGSGRCPVVDPDCGGRAAARFGAGRYVLGQVIPVGPDRFELIATVYGGGGTPESIRSAAVRSSPEAAIDALARGLVAAESGGSETTLAGVAALTSTSLDALKAYLEGERAFRALDVFTALDAFGRALAEDSTFALAHYRRAETAAWAARFDLVDVHLQQAMQYQGRLPDRARRLLEAFDVWWRGNAPAAEAAYRSTIATHPDDVTAWYWLAETLLHGNSLRGRPTTPAEEAFEHVLTLDPGLVGAMFHLAELKARAGKVSELDSLADRFIEQNEEPAYSLFVEAPRWLAIRDEAGLQELAGRAALIDDDPLVGGLFNAPVFTKNLEGGSLLLSELIDPRRAPFVRAAGHLALAHLDVARGRWVAARTHLAEAGALRPGLALEHRAYLASLPWARLPHREAQELLTELMGWDGAVPSGGPYDRELFLPIFLEPHVGSHGPIKLYLQGLLSDRVGDAAAVRSYAARLDTARLPPRVGSFAPDAARTLRALAAASEGDSSAALREVEAAEMRVTYPLMFSSPFHSRARHRFLRARLLASVGQEVRALEWYATVTDQSIYDLVYLAPAALRQGEIQERLGDPAAAVDHYRRFVELWRECDAELRPLVEEVEERIERLSSG